MLSTLALLASGIEKHQAVNGINFYRKLNLRSRQRTPRREASYPIWVRNENTLPNGTAKQVSKFITKFKPNESEFADKKAKANKRAKGKSKEMKHS